MEIHPNDRQPQRQRANGQQPQQQQRQQQSQRQASGQQAQRRANPNQTQGNRRQGQQQTNQAARRQSTSRPTQKMSNVNPYQQTQNPNMQPTQPYPPQRGQNPGDYPPNYYPVPPQKKMCVMGVIALVLGIIALLGAFIPLLNILGIPFALVGLGLGIAGVVVVKKNPDTKSGFGVSLAGAILSLISLIVCVLMYASVATYVNNNSEAVNETINEIEQNINESITESRSETVDNIAVSFTAMEQSTDRAGNPVLIVRYDVTNNSEETITPAMEVIIKCYQNNVSLESNYMSSTDSGVTTEIQPGGTYNASAAFTITDMATPIDVQAQELISFGETKIFAQETFTPTVAPATPEPNATVPSEQLPSQDVVVPGPETTPGEGDQAATIDGTNDDIDVMVSPEPVMPVPNENTV